MGNKYIAVFFKTKPAACGAIFTATGFATCFAANFVVTHVAFAAELTTMTATLPVPLSTFGTVELSFAGDAFEPDWA